MDKGTGVERREKGGWVKGKNMRNLSVEGEMGYRKKVRLSRAVGFLSSFAYSKALFVPQYYYF